MVWGMPFSVMAKSFAVSPSMGLPLLSFTVTCCTTRRVSERKTVRLLCCRGRWRPAARRSAEGRDTEDEREGIGAWLEPHSQRCLESAHRARRIGQAELRAGDDGVPTGEDGMIESVGGIHAQVGVQAVAPAESAAGGGVEAELGRTGDGVAARVAPLVRGGSGVGGGVQVQSGGRGIGIGAGVVGADAAGDAGAADGREGGRSERQSGAVIELGDDGPFAEESCRCGR